MPDQADQLRELVREALVTTGTAPAGYVAVVGSSARVGVTSLVIGVARELGSLGARVLVVDANLARPHVGDQLRLHATSDLHAVLGGRRRLAEATVPAPFGAAVLCTANEGSDAVSHGQGLDVLIRELRASGERYDAVLVDVGAPLSPWGDRLCRRAAQTLIVGTVRADDVRSSYALVKSLAPDVQLRLAMRGPVTTASEVARKIGATALEFTGNNPLVGATIVLADGVDDAAIAECRRSHRLLAAEFLAPLRVAHLRVARTSWRATAGASAVPATAAGAMLSRPT